MQDASRQRLELILRQVDALPALPDVAAQALHVASSDNDDVRACCAAIDADATLAARVIRLAGPPDADDVTTLDRDVQAVGFDAVRSATLAVAVFDTLGPDASADESALIVNVWKHAIAVAACGELLAGELIVNWGAAAGVTPAEALLAGLLHDVGKPALDRTVPKSYAKVIEAVDLLRGNIADVERSILGVDHQVVGKRLAERWQLPTSLRDAIWLHGQLPQALPASVRNARLVNLVTLADLLVREQHLGYSGNYAFPVARDALVNTLGLLPAQVDAVLGRLIAATDARAAALGLGTGGAHGLYRGALQEANRQLSRAGEQIARRDHRLNVRAKYFEAIAAFQNVLRPDAPPATVLAAIGQTAAGVLGGPAACAFSLTPGAGYAEIGVVDASGQVVHSEIVDVPPGQTARRPDAGDGPLFAAGHDLEWLVAAFSPRLVGTARFWIPLEADGVCIGGVVWGGHDNEPERLAAQTQELTALASGWSLALRTCQIRDESRALAEQLAEVNRRLQTAQSEIYRTRMLTSVAQIAAGAAHEMNNPLMVISGRSQLLATTLEDPKHRDAAKLIFEKSQTLSDLITALMHFAKPEPPRPVACEVAGLFRLAVERATKVAPVGNRKIETRLADVPPALADGPQIADALAEVIVNAVQATDVDNGRVTLGGSFDAFGQRLVLTVTDNGRGMDADTLAHAFDPFFSAKTAGRQQGMGLSKAQRWAESSNGSLRLESRPNGGTRAILILPAGLSATTMPARPLRQASI